MFPMKRLPLLLASLALLADMPLASDDTKTPAEEQVAAATRQRPRKRVKTSNFPGVAKRGNKWSAQICRVGKSYHLGTFAEEQDAAAAFEAARQAADSNRLEEHLRERSWVQDQQISQCSDTREALHTKRPK